MNAPNTMSEHDKQKEKSQIATFKRLFSTPLTGLLLVPT